MIGVMERTTAGKFRHLPVVEENRLIGIVSIGDVVKYRVQQFEFESAALRDYISSALGECCEPTAYVRTGKLASKNDIIADISR